MDIEHRGTWLLFVGVTSTFLLATGCQHPMVAIASYSRNVPIRFWGQVVDESNVALKDVQVRAEARHFGMNVTYPHRDVLTDKDGRFEIKNLSGDVLTINSLEKDGYAPEPSALRWFGYNISTNHTPDPNHPTILRMWKTNVHEKLMMSLPYNSSFRITPNGNVHTINLIPGKTSTNLNADGDLRIRIIRPEHVSGMGDLKWDWLADVEMIDGGFCPESDPLIWMTHAPNEGYVGRIQFEHLAAKPRWTPSESQKYYFLSHQKYGKMEMTIHSYCDPDGKNLACLHVTWFINPSGSRVLR